MFYPHYTLQCTSAYYVLRVFVCVCVCARLLLLQIGFGFTLFVNYNLFSLNSYLFTHAPLPFTNTLTHNGTHLRTDMFTPNNQHN